MNKLDPSIQRQMFWSKDVGGKSYCPRCFSSLDNEHQVFLMVIRDAQDISPFIVGNDAGYFCPKCPTVVLDYDAFLEFAQLSLGRYGDAEFTVVGLIDLEAVPEDKRSLPLGSDDNPFPLVKFTNIIFEEKSKQRKTSALKKKKKRLKQKKRR